MSSVTEFHQEGGLIHVVRKGDVEPAIRQAKALRDAGVLGSSDLKLAAEIPDVIVEKYINDNGITWQQFLEDKSHVKRLVNDPINSVFRVWQGRI